VNGQQDIAAEYSLSLPVAFQAVGAFGRVVIKRK